MRVGEETRREIAAALWGKRGLEARTIVRDLAAHTGLSEPYIYQLSAEARATGRARRQDAGQPRLRLEEAHYLAVQGLTVNYDLAAWHGIRMAEQNGLIPPGLLTEARYNTWLRAQHTTRTRLKRDTAPARRFEAEAPNVLHHFDTTKLEQLHLREGILTWDHAANRKNSRGEKPAAIWLYSLVDDHSRSKFAYLYPSLNQYNHLDFFYRAWTRKENPTEFPFFGIPQHLYMDRGGANQAQKVSQALTKLGVHDVETTPSTWEPHGARKHGKIERVFQDYNEWLKTFQIRPHTWEEAQASLYQFVLHLNRRVHSGTRQPPFQRWLTIRLPQHMPNADLYAALYYEHEQRTVSKFLTVSIDRHEYLLPAKRPFVDWVDRRVDIYRKPGEYDRVILVLGSVEIEVPEHTENLVRPAFEYRNFPHTAGQQARAKSAEEDHATMALWADSTPSKAAYLPRKGAAFDDTKIAEKTVTTKEGRERPRFAPARWVNQFYVNNDVRAFFADTEEGKRQRLLFVEGIMNGRTQINEDELTLAKERLRNEKTGTEG